MKRILGIDYGSRRIGVAISSEGNTSAFPLTTVDRREDNAAIKELANICVEKDIGRVVIGLPLDQTGAVGPAAERVQQFGALLGKNISLPVAYIDERFTSAASQTVMHSDGRRNKHQRSAIDAVSAQEILQTYLDQQHVSG